MLHFNSQEKIFILCASTVFFLGSTAQIMFKTFPGLSKAVRAADNKRFYPKTDINSADEHALIKVPYIGEFTAARIVAHRAANGKFRSLTELMSVEGIRKKNFERFSPYLTVK